METFLKRNFLGLLISSFLMLTFFVKSNRYFSIDLQITWVLQQFRQDWVFYLMKIITQSGNMPGAGLILLCIVGLFVYFNKKKEGIMILLSASGITVISELIKTLIQRPRPTQDLLLYQIGNYSHNDSYPSGHVLFAIGLYGFLLFLVFEKLRKGILKVVLFSSLLFLLISMGLSRIYLGAHWFSDTLGSYLFGAIWLYFMVGIYRKIVNYT